MDNFFKLFLVVLFIHSVLGQNSPDIEFFESEDFTDPLNDFFLNVRGPPDAVVDIEDIIAGSVQDKTYVDLNNFGVTSMDFKSVVTAEHGGILSPFVQLECDSTCITNSADFHEGGIVITFNERISGVQLFTFTGNPNEKIRVYEYESNDLLYTYDLNGDSESNDFQFTGIYDHSFNGIGSIEIDGSYWALYYVAIWDMGPRVTMIEMELNGDGNFIDITDQDITALEIDEGTQVQFRITAEDPLGNDSAISYYWSLVDVNNNPPHVSTTKNIFVTSQQSVNQGIITIDYDLTGSDGKGVTSLQFIITVNNVLPLLVFDPDQNLFEGTVGAITFSIEDPGINDSHTFSISPAPSGTNPEDFVCNDPMFCGLAAGTNAISFNAANIDGPSTRRYCGYITDEVGDGPVVCSDILVKNQVPIPFLPDEYLSSEGVIQSGNIVTIMGRNEDPYNPEEIFAVYTWVVPGALSISYGNAQYRNPAIITYPIYSTSVEYDIYLNVTDKDGGMSLEASVGRLTIDPNNGNPNDDGGNPNDDGGNPNDDGGNPNDDGGNPNDDGGDPNNPSEPTTNNYVCVDTSENLGVGTVVFDMCGSIEPITPSTWDGDNTFDCAVDDLTNHYRIRENSIAHRNLQTHWSTCFSFHLTNDYSCSHEEVLEETFGFSIQFLLMGQNEVYSRSDSTAASNLGANNDYVYCGLSFKSAISECGDGNLEVGLSDNLSHYVIQGYDTYDLPITVDPGSDFDENNEYFVTLTHTPDYLNVVVANDSSGASFGNSAVKIFEATYVFEDGDSFSSRLQGSNQQDIFVVFTSATDDEIGVPIIIDEFSFHDETP